MLRIILARLCLALDFSPALGPATNTPAENNGFLNDMDFPGGLREDDGAGAGAGARWGEEDAILLYPRWCGYMEQRERLFP